MKKLITKEQKKEVAKLAQTSHGDSIVAYGSVMWNNGYNRGVLMAGVTCLVTSAICYAWDWIRTRG